MNIELKPRNVARFLLVLTICFILTNIAGQLAQSFLGAKFELDLFNIDQEQSITKFYSAVTLLLCSGLLLIIAMAKKDDHTRNYLYWSGLVTIFLFFALAKTTAIQEYLFTPIQLALHLTKIQFYALAYGIVVILFPVIYLKFLLSLPRQTMFLFAIGGTVFVAGAFGIDLIAAYLGKLFDHQTVVYIVLTILEQVFELVGVIVFLYALMLYIGSELKWIRVRIAK